jgi:transcriptional regulator with PAS, ATPase and Fis domain
MPMADVQQLVYELQVHQVELDLQNEELQRAQQELEATLEQIASSRDDLRVILNQLRVGTVMTDEHGRITFCSEACQAFCHQPLAAVVGQEWMHAFPFTPQDLAQLQAMRQRFPRLRTSVPVHLTLPGGRHYWVDIELHDEPHDPRRTMLLFYDTTAVHDLHHLLDDKAQFHGFISTGDAMLQVYEVIRQVAAVETTVLIEGETGVGKELAAKALHASSPRSAQPFIAMNCAGLTESLLASQLFGHKRGAFTGAIADQKGLLEAADGGTLFLDEVGDMSLAVQTSLLRVLQEREITRLGEIRPRPIDVRIIAATQHDLGMAVAAGSFRADLLYRLHVVKLTIPPLREHAEDIPLLVNAFLLQARAVTHKPVQEVSHAAMRALLSYVWPGNIRELKSTSESAVMRCRTHVSQPEDLPPALTQRALPLFTQTFPDEQQRLLVALEQTHGNRAAAARLLGIGRTTLYRRLAHLGRFSTS